MNAIFCDYLGVTVPLEHGDLLDRVRPFLDLAGFAVDWDGEHKLVLRSRNDGTVVWQKRFGVWCLSASGGACSAIRASGQWLAFLAELGATPHRVTRLDAALDVVQDAAPEVQRLRAEGAKGLLSITRKSVRPEHVDTHLSNGATGETGTVYIGSRQAEARLVVYDKRHERFMATGEDVGPLTRYELRVKSGIGVTLRDVAEPAAVFWHHVGRSVLSAPAGVPEWVGGAEGYSIDRSGAPTAFQRLVSRVESSAEVLALVKLAAELGPYGVEVLVSEVRKVAGRSEPSMGLATGTRAMRAPGHGGSRASSISEGVPAH